MARHSHDRSASRRIFIAWMMALPIAGRAAAQAGANPEQVKKAWLDENVPPDDTNRERVWRDENIPLDQRSERCWLDENVPPDDALLQRAWRDENIPPDAKKKLRQRCWLDEAIAPPRR